MIFSVYNYDTHNFDYFEAPGTSSDFGGRGTKYRPLSQPPQGPRSAGLGGKGGIGLIGFAPEALCLKLPANATRIGSGAQARGVIASQGTSPMMSGYGPRFPSGVTMLPTTMSAALSGLGDAPPATPPVVAEVQYPLGKVVFAACIASVVGVLVQRALK